LLLGLTQSELALAAGVSQALISQIEGGRRPVTDDLLESIAAATQTPKSFFSVEPADVPEGSLRFRKYATTRLSETHRIEELTKEAWRVFAQLMRDLDYPLPSLPAYTEHDAVDVEGAAAEVRRGLGLDQDRPISHLTRVVEHHGIAVIPIMLPSLDPEVGEGIGHFGVSCWPSRLDYAVIGVFAGSGDRERFTVAHELGHMVLHSRRRSVKDPEEEANHFAGALLLPQARMIEAFAGAPPTLMELARLKARWGVSIQALIMRGSHLGLIDAARKTSLFKQLSARRWRMNEPVVVQREESLLPWKLLERSHGTSPYTTAAHRLGVAPMILRGWAPKASAG
jgi:Zn-dependent peptidase ImmA (M78 family)/transcriptional regulator with XRE-family HTH domain